jgi:exodeoxyribonuclease-3
MKNPGFSPRERDWMEQFINSGYVDTFRIFNKEPDNYTWWSYRFNAREKNIGWRIDYFCIDIESKKRILNASIIPEIRGSDHCPVCVEFV